MKRLFPAFAVLALSSPVLGQELTTTLQKISYGIGLQIAQTLRQRGLSEVDSDALALAVNDALTGADLKLSREELTTAFSEYQATIEAAQAEAGKANSESGQQFLAENKTNDGITELESGVQYQVVEEGNGDKPAASDTVVVNYRGRLLDGTEFDSSFERNQPAEFGVGSVIPGWQEVLQLMPVGAKWRVWIPSALAYGEQGRPPTIGPNSVLDFDIELLEVKAEEVGTEESGTEENKTQ